MIHRVVRGPEGVVRPLCLLHPNPTRRIVILVDSKQKCIAHPRRDCWLGFVANLSDADRLLSRNNREVLPESLEKLIGESTRSLAAAGQLSY